MTNLRHDYPDLLGRHNTEPNLDPPDDDPEWITRALEDRAEDEMRGNARVFADWLDDQWQDCNPLALEIVRAALYAHKFPADENCSIALDRASEALLAQWTDYRLRTFDYWDRKDITESGSDEF